MIYEIATLHIREGEDEAFVEAVKAAAPYFKASKGCRGLALERSVETPNRYFLKVQWETLEDHTVHFRGAPEFQEWRRLASPFFVSPPSVEHASVVAELF